jgi:hypothetical protein
MVAKEKTLWKNTLPKCIIYETAKKRVQAQNALSMRLQRRGYKQAQNALSMRLQRRGYKHKMHYLWDCKEEGYKHNNL